MTPGHPTKPGGIHRGATKGQAMPARIGDAASCNLIRGHHDIAGKPPRSLQYRRGWAETLGSAGQLDRFDSTSSMTTLRRARRCRSCSDRKGFSTVAFESTKHPIASLRPERRGCVVTDVDLPAASRGSGCNGLSALAGQDGPRRPWSPLGACVGLRG